MDNEMNFEVVETSEENVTVDNDLSAKLEEAGTLSEKACIAIGALALAGTVALGNMAWKGGKKAVNFVRGKLDDRKAAKEAKKDQKAEETEEEKTKDSKEETPEK